MKTMKMFATTTLLIAGILFNQAFAQSAQNATTNAQKSTKSEMKTATQNAALSANQKATESKAASTTTQASKPASQSVAVANKTSKPEATAMNKEVSPKHHRGHKAHKQIPGTVNKNKNESAKALKPADKPKSK
jgi:hypothetical protein